MKHNGSRTDQIIATNASLSQPTIPKVKVSQATLAFGVALELCQYLSS